MLIYLASIACIPIYHFFIRNRKWFVIVVTVHLFMLLALRDVSLGVDLPNYAGGYSYISSLSFGEVLQRLHLIDTAELIYPYSYESGYVLINWLISAIGFDFHGFLVLHAAFCMIAFGWFVFRYSKIPWLSFMLFASLGMYFYLFGILRQTLALSVLLFAIPAILDKKRGKVILLIVIAFLIHRSAILFVFLYIFKERKMSRDVMTKYIVFCMIALVLSPYIYRYAIVPVLSLLGKKRYIEIQFSWNNQILMMFAIILIILLFVNFDMFQQKATRLALWGFLLAFPVEIIGMCNDGFARAVQYYLIFICLLVPAVIDEYPDKRISGIAKFAVAVAVFLFAVYLLPSSYLVPYVLYHG